nr:hypothetical protein DA06_20080 [Georgenia sp. SUBG003]
MLPGRSGDPFDVVADVVGVGLGALAAWWLAGRAVAAGGPAGEAVGHPAPARRPGDVRDGARGRTGRGPSGPSR